LATVRLQLSILCAWSLWACGTKAQEPPPPASHPADPWNQPAPSVASSAVASSAAAGLGAGDLQQLLAGITANLNKPGPYEDPEQGPGYDDDRGHFAVVSLGVDIAEQPSFSLLSGFSGESLRAVMLRLDALGRRSHLDGIILRMDGFSASLTDALELRAAMLRFRDDGKKLLCHAERADNVTYLVMTGCEQIVLAPLGELVIAGPAAMPVHLRPLLDKLGVKADFLHVGAYKGAAEPLTRDAPSPQMKETLGVILDRHYQSLVESIAQGRNLPPERVRAAIDTAMFSATQARAEKLVDDVLPWETFRALATQGAWIAVELEQDDHPLHSMQGMLKLAEFLGATPPRRPSGPHLALVYAVGDVIDGDGDGALGASGQIASHTLVPALRALAADDSVKAVVLRIDSGGGSALASELIWHAVTELRQKKPVVVSMSNVAASGGYYIAAGATKIFALADTLTGSIGVVGGKLAVQGALDKLGVKTYPMGRGKRATMFSSVGAWSSDERAAVQRSMDAVYETFVARVAAGRGKSPDQVKAIAQGRVWTGADGKRLGLIDELGGLDAAVAEASRLGGVAPDAELEVYPGRPTLRDVLHGLGQVSARLEDDAVVAPLLRRLPPPLARAVRSLWSGLLTFEGSTIQARAFLPVVGL
jgi:protease-4